MKPLTDAHDTSKATFNKLAESRSLLDKVRVEMTTLSKLGYLVTEEDVIKGAGKLVAAGLSPMALAKLMSDLPDNGPGIGAWLSSHASAIATREAQLTPVLEAARHSLSVSAMRVLAGHHLGGPDQSEATTPISNALAPTAAAASTATSAPNATASPQPAAGGLLNA